MSRARVLILLLLLPILVQAQPSVCADSNETRNCCGATEIAACPVIGCGGDSELNTKKNRTDIPTQDIEPKTFTQLTAFKRPQSWTSGTGRFLLETWGEGKAIVLKGFVFEADNYTQGAESTNCHLKTNDFNDFHVVLVEDLGLADKWKIAEEKVKTLEDAGGTSTTAKNKLKAP